MASFVATQDINSNAETQQQTVVSSLTKQLGVAFRETVDNTTVNLEELKTAFNKVFTGVSNEKYKQIFDSFNENSSNVIDYYELLNNDKLPSILISLYNDTLSTPYHIAQTQSINSISDDFTLSEDAEPHPTSYNPKRRQSALSLSETTPMYPTKAPFFGYNSSLSFEQTKSGSFDKRNNLLNLANISTIRSQPSMEESVTSLEMEINQKEEQIKKCQNWIENIGLPAQKSVLNLQTQISHEQMKRSEYEQEIEQFRKLNEDLQRKNIDRNNRVNELSNEYKIIVQQHKSTKILAEELQKNCDEYKEKYNKEKKKTKNLAAITTDLRKLNKQYETVNDDFQSKIDSYKEDLNDAKGRYMTLESFAEQLIEENEIFRAIMNEQRQQQYNELNSNNNSDDDDSKAPSRKLSGIEEHQETASKRPGFRNDQSAQPSTHPVFNRSTSMNLTLSSLASLNMNRAQSGQSNTSGHAKRNSLLYRIRSFTAVTPTGNTPMLGDGGSVSGFPDTPSMGYNHSAQPSEFGDTAPLMFHNSNNTPLPLLSNTDSNNSQMSHLSHQSGVSSMYGRGGQRRSRRISFITIGPSRKRTLVGNMMNQSLEALQQGMDDTASQRSGLDSNLDGINENDDDGGYADQFYEDEDGDDDEENADQLADLTEQIRKEVKQEMEEGMEAEINRKYTLKTDKMTLQHNQQIMLLQTEIERLTRQNRKQIKKYKALEKRKSDNRNINIVYSSNDDDQKTTEQIVNDKGNKVGINANGNENNGSNDDQESDDDDDDLVVIGNAYDEYISTDDIYQPILSEDSNKKKRKKKHHHRSKSHKKEKEKEKERRRKEKRKKKKEAKKLLKKQKREEKQTKEAKKAGFCCSSVFGAFGKSKQKDYKNMEPKRRGSGSYSKVKHSKKLDDSD